MKQNDILKLNILKNKLVESNKRFKKCYVCHAVSTKGGMTFHHLWYEPDEKVYSDFRGNNLEYYKYLEIQIKKNPNRFLYVCNVHHQAIERLARWKGKNRERLIKAVRMTR